MESGPRESKDEKFLLKLENLVLQHLEDEDFGVQELAREAGYSRSQLYRRIKLLVGVSTSVFIRRIRLKEALEMLRHDEATTSEIAYRVGFHSPSYFHRCFQNFYGITPGSFKEVCQREREYIPNQESPSPTPPVEAPAPIGKRNNFVKKSILSLTLIVLSVVIIIANFLPEETTETPVRPTIAVLPFAYLSAQEETRYFADGMADNLILSLAALDTLKVISRTTSENYRDREGRSVREIAEALDAEYLIEGSVQCLGNRARIQIKIIHAKSDTPIWSKMFDRGLQDQFSVQSEISTLVTSKVNDLIVKGKVSS